jgi:hypothetical protein
MRNFNVTVVLHNSDVQRKVQFYNYCVSGYNTYMVLFLFKTQKTHSVSETGLCLRLQVEPT